MTRIRVVPCQAKIFGEAIKKRRQAKELTVEEAASLADISWHSWDGLERGENKSIVIWQACAAALGLDLSIELVPR